MPITLISGKLVLKLRQGVSCCGFLGYTVIKKVHCSFTRQHVSAWVHREEKANWFTMCDSPGKQRDLMLAPNCFCFECFSVSLAASYFENLVFIDMYAEGNYWRNFGCTDEKQKWQIGRKVSTIGPVSVFLKRRYKKNYYSTLRLEIIFVFLYILPTK